MTLPSLDNAIPSLRQLNGLGPSGSNRDSGNSVTPSSGEKAGTQFYFAEATGWYDGYSGIGENNWYDMDDIHIYDVE